MRADVCDDFENDDFEDDVRSYAEHARRSVGHLVRTNQLLSHHDNAQFSRATNLEDEQVPAFERIAKWVSDVKGSDAAFFAKPVFTLGGFAGTGKTTLLGFLARDLVRKYRVAFCTLTGKAASVLARSLEANGVRPEYVGTIHRMMYVPEIDEETGAIKGWTRADHLDYDLIVVDEASMMSMSILKDMQVFSIPVLAVGDHGQLPPIDDQGVMASPDVRLSKVRRQALDNPIIATSVMVRRGMNWRQFIKDTDDERIRFVPRDDLPALVTEGFRGFLNRPLSEDPLLLCGINRTRVGLNKIARFGIESKEPVVVGDRVICLKNAYFQEGLVANGFRGRVKSIGYSANPMQVNATIEFEEEGLELQGARLCKLQFGRDKTFATYKEVNEFCQSWREVGLLFDHGNALTVHKAQGSQAETGILVVERFQAVDEDFLRWLYTGLTRFSKSVVVTW